MSCGDSNLSSSETEDFSKCYIGSEYKTDYKIISEWNDFLVTGYSHYNIYLKSSFENDRVFGEYITDINYKWRVFYILDDLYHRVGSDRFTVYIISNNSKVKLFYNQKSLPSDYTEYVNTLYKNGEVLFWSGFIDSSMITMVDYYG